MRLSRFQTNPILTPSAKWWEMRAVFNPAATIFHDQVLLLYRAVGGDGLSRLGLAISNNGEEFQRFPEPVFEASSEEPLERLGVEDPRITKIEDTYYIVYTAASVYPASYYNLRKFAPSVNHPAPWRVRPSLLITQDFKNFERKGILLDKDTKDACLFPEKIAERWALIHRIYPNVYLSFSPDLKNWEEEKVLLSPREGFWDSERVGAGTPPLKTSRGWLLFYHGVSKEHSYSVGLLLLDLTDPSKVIYRSEEPLLSPEEDFEKIGETPNVVFATGVVEEKDKYFVYYGAADRTIGLAFLDKRDF